MKTAPLPVVPPWSVQEPVAKAPETSETAQQPQLRDLDQEPYRTPRAGEGFRTVVMGEEVEVESRDRRSVAEPR